LRKLSWFKFCESHLDWLNVALSTGVLAGLSFSIPAAWRSPPRNQLDASELKKRCTIIWNVPKALLEAALNVRPLHGMTSPAIYMAGTGVQLELTPRKQEGGSAAFGVFLKSTSYTQHGSTLCEPGSVLSCQYKFQRQVPLAGGAQMCEVSKGQATLNPIGWGKPAVIKASTPADLEPYLVDGHLKLQATVSMITA
jgi:hypothetical protein